MTTSSPPPSPAPRNVPPPAAGPPAADQPLAAQPDTSPSGWPPAFGPPSGAPLLPSYPAALPPTGLGFVPQRKYDGFSIAAFVFSIIGGVLLGYILGIVGLVRTKRGIRRGRWMAVTSLVLSTLWLLLIGAVVATVALTSAERDAAGRVVESGHAAFGTLRVGDCIKDSPKALSVGVELTPCTQAHASEVFAIFPYPNATSSSSYPGLNGIKKAADKGCTARLPAKMPADDRLALYFYYPLESDWKRGDRDLTCLLATEGSALTKPLVPASAGR